METQTFIFFGQVGSGKGTQVKLLMDFLKKRDGKDQIYISTGVLYRKLIESGNYTGSLVKTSLEKGVLQPDFLTTSMVAGVLMDSLDTDKHLLTDGYPRTVTQSEAIEAMMKFYKRKNVKIIYIELSEEEATKRNMLRGRTDDTEEGLRQRFNEYKNNVIPAMNYFKEKEGYEIYTINGEQPIEEVHNDIIKALNL